MRAALDDLAATRPGRRVAVLGDMLELGADEAAFHARSARYAAQRGVDVLVAVGPRAAAMASRFGGDGRDRGRRRRGGGRRAQTSCARATPCSSRPRAASGSRPSSSALRRGG